MRNWKLTKEEQIPCSSPLEPLSDVLPALDLFDPCGLCKFFIKRWTPFVFLRVEAWCTVASRIAFWVDRSYISKFEAALVLSGVEDSWIPLFRDIKDVGEFWDLQLHMYDDRMRFNKLHHNLLLHYTMSRPVDLVVAGCDVYSFSLFCLINTRSFYDRVRQSTTWICHDASQW